MRVKRPIEDDRVRRRDCGHVEARPFAWHAIVVPAAVWHGWHPLPRAVRVCSERDAAPYVHCALLKALQRASG
jgi:hypothetical protein